MPQWRRSATWRTAFQLALYENVVTPISRGGADWGRARAGLSPNTWWRQNTSRPLLERSPRSRSDKYWGIRCKSGTPRLWAQTLAWGLGEGVPILGRSLRPLLCLEVDPRTIRGSSVERPWREGGGQSLPESESGLLRMLYPGHACGDSSGLRYGGRGPLKQMGIRL